MKPINMLTITTALFLCLSTAGTGLLHAAPTALGYPVLVADYGGKKVCRVNAEGNIDWRIEANGPQDVWLLPNGNVLFSHVKGVREVTLDEQQKTVWEYTTAATNEIHACQPLPDGNVMVAESGPCRLIEVNRSGRIVKAVKLTTTCARAHGQMRAARKLKSGHYVVGQYSDGVVREYDATGQIVWEFKHPMAFSGIRLPNGNTLVATGDAHKVLEVDRDGKTVWQIAENDLPGTPLRFVAGLQRRANGNTMICNWGGHGHVGQQAQVVEVAPDGSIVATLFDNAQFKTISGVFVIGEKGNAAQYELLR